MNVPITDGERLGRQGIGRRELIVGAAALAALAACSNGDDDGGRSGSTTTTSAPPTTRHTARLSGDPFGLGVASGDPLADSVILWTRLGPDPLADDAKGGMPDDPVDVIWEIATDERFRKIAGRGVATAEPDAGHSVHVDADGLDPATDYHYRFTVGDFTSPVGRTRTLVSPGDSPGRFALAIANCQMIDAGRYAAYRHMADEDLDLVLHLGDYIYEYPGARFLPNRIPENLADYRLRYANYKSDADLQAAHARFPFACTWDDHEVLNNYMGDTLPSGAPQAEVRERKAAAYRAWWENLPLRAEAPAPDEGALPVHHSLDAGGLARVYVLDERQYGEEPPCRDVSLAEADFGDCEARAGEDRTRLGTEQEQWFEEATADSNATWNLVGNPVVLAGVDVGAGDEPGYFLDTWDGYPQARLRLIEAMAEADNPVVLTGDWHNGMVLDVHRRPFDQDSEVVATELMSPAISSVIFPQDASIRTPQLRQQIDKHGYLTVEVTPDQLTGTFRVLDNVTEADSGISTEATWVIAAGEPRATKQ